MARTVNGPPAWINEGDGWNRPLDECGPRQLVAREPVYFSCNGNVYALNRLGLLSNARAFLAYAVSCGPPPHAVLMLFQSEEAS